MSELSSNDSNFTFNPKKNATIKNGANQNDSPFQEIQVRININEIKDGLNANDANNENSSQHSAVQYVFDSKKLNELIASNGEMKESIKDMSDSIKDMSDSIKDMSDSIKDMSDSIDKMIKSNDKTRNVMKEAVDEMKKNNFNQTQLLGILQKRLFPEKKKSYFSTPTSKFEPNTANNPTSTCSISSYPNYDETTKSYKLLTTNVDESANVINEYGRIKP